MTPESIKNLDEAIEQRRAVLRRRQRDLFCTLLYQVWRKSPFYRELYSAAGIKERDLPTVQLEDLPIIDKKLLMDSFDQAVTDPRLKKSDLARWISEVGDPAQNYLEEFIVCQSSGSSGVKGFSVCTFRDWELASSAMATRLPVPVNHGTGKTKVAFYLLANGNASGVSGAVRMPRSVYDLCILSILEAREKVIDRLNEFQPHQLHGYASSIFELARLAVRGQLRISPRQIFVSGEKLTDEMEREIHQAWAPDLIDCYSASESRFIAVRQSGETAMNIIDELNILEMLDSDNRQVETGQSGRGVLTNLYNVTLPLIRYEMGDYLVCGAPNSVSPIKTIKEISGRTTHPLPIRLHDGSEGTISQIVLAVFYVPHLERIQFVSLAQDRVRILYVGAENLDRAIRNEFQRFLDRLGATRTSFEVRRVASIDPDPRTGKYSFVVAQPRSGATGARSDESPHVIEARASEPVSASMSVIGNAASGLQSSLGDLRGIPGLPPHQQKTLRECFHPSGGTVEFAEGDVETSIPARFEKMVRLYGDRLAVIAGNSCLTYAEVNRAANRVARTVLAQRGSVNEPVALLLQTGVNAVIAILGVLKAGKAYVPLEINEPPARLSAMLTDSQTPVLITETFFVPTLAAMDSLQEPVLEIDKILSEGDDANIDSTASAGDMAYIMYTSGSTGEPKGVIQSHRNILHKVFTHTWDYRICPEDRLSLLYSYSFSASVRCVFGALLNGAALVLGDVRQEGLERVAKRIIAEQVTLYFSVPSLFRELAICLANLKVPSRVRLIYLASETVSKQDVELYKRCFDSNCILVHSLSTGETGTIRQYFINKTTGIAGGLVPVGYQVRDQEVLVLDEHHEPAGLNRPGEIAVRSRFLSPGYWQKPELTRSKFLDDPEDSGARIYLTGDLGLMRSDGCLEYHGRKDFQVKVRGQSVDPAEVEAVLRECESVGDTVVVSRSNDAGENELVGYVVPEGETLPTSSALRHVLSARLPNHMIPSVFVVLDALPLTRSGKVDRRRLPEPGSIRPTLPHPYVPPRTATEQQLAVIWTEVLALDRVGVEDSFFDLGGHSLGAARILTRVGSELHVDLPMSSLFDRPTIAGMAQAILTEQASSVPPEVVEQILTEVESMVDEDS